MAGPIATWVVASRGPTASCRWWDSDAGPSWLFIIGCIIAFVVLIVLFNRFGDRF